MNVPPAPASLQPNGGLELVESACDIAPAGGAPGSASCQRSRDSSDSVSLTSTSPAPGPNPVIATS
jgi:hypothetical protein